MNSFSEKFYETQVIGCDNSAGHVVGIIDAESFLPDFFNYEKQLQIAKVCRDLGTRFF